MKHVVLDSAEKAVGYLEAQPPSGDSFGLAIAESFTFAGQPDSLGVGMAIVVDKVLALGFEPDGFTQMDGYRMYHYRRSR